MDANGNTYYQESRVCGWKNNTHHSRNSRRKRKTLGKGSLHRGGAEIRAEPITTEKRSKDRIHLSLAELRKLLPKTDSGAMNKEPGYSQEELLTMAVEYLRTRQIKNSTALSAEHSATATPHSKRSRRKQQHQHNDQVTESAATPQHNVAFRPSSPTNAMLEGFRECMEETIRYLVEVERLAPDHEIVVRLRAHLLKAQSKLDLNNRGSRLDSSSSSSSSYTTRVRKTHESNTTQESCTSTQTSPEAVYSNSPHIPVWVPSGDSAHTSSRTVPAAVVRTSGLPNSATARKVMKPLTVDTNQYYAMPSPLSHISSDSNQSGVNSNESLLTIARTIPTTTQPTYSTASVTGRAISYQRQTALGPSYLHRPHHTTGPTMVYSTATLTTPIAATVLPSSVTAATGHHLGFNLNYVAPYIMAWVRPAQQL